MEQKEAKAILGKDSTTHGGVVYGLSGNLSGGTMRSIRNPTPRTPGMVRASLSKAKRIPIKLLSIMIIGIFMVAQVPRKMAMLANLAPLLRNYKAIGNAA